MRSLAKVGIAALAAALVCLVVAAGVGGATGTTGTGAGAQAQTSSASPPPSNPWPIPFGPKRKREMADYSERHYGQHRWRLRNPKVIVEHMAQTPTAEALFNTFAHDNPDPELGELPNVCAHYGISGSGKIFRFVNLRTRCRHTVGLNWTAIGIEHVGYGDGDLMGDRSQLRASLRLTQYLRCRFDIGVRNVIGHNESLSSPYHYERVPSLRTQTHGDMDSSSMRVYRQKLRRLGAC
ncbi:MAG TPA: peptidoglycan recognition family protein [Solirubrobacterales bacterium]|nr:peptidoglycan recognition family protein [Solirubrobacterales bacterium]